ncbi:hypothetical protein IV80_GL000968 [Pediococcus cellicola]|uniref:6-carboxy-5,6,7,8-tetrahydropterin synthase n=2 Tax=Pediococcus cellicola TaxID=319652 RepID=A0A0R2IPC7_9LACO|nr:hypothetical protein IV80_GL000968 [Pediococcus cellicola]
MRWKGGEGKQHNHTWEIVCEIHTKGDHMIIFNDLEKAVTEILSQINGKFLNDLDYFKKINSSVENVTEYLFDQIGPELKKLEASLIRIEVGESPTRFYCITVDD